MPARSRPLLTASAGVASLTLTAAGCIGNPMPPPPCPVTQVRVDGYNCADECYPGTAVMYPTGTGYDSCEPIDAGSDASRDASTDAGPDASDDGDLGGG